MSNKLLHGRLFPAVLGGGGPSLPSYSSILINTYGASEVWPLVDIASGTTITARVNSARNGAETGWTLQNAAGPVAGTLAPYSADTNDTGNVDSVSLRSAFNGAIGSAICFAKVDTNVWAETTPIRWIFQFRADANNEYLCEKLNAANYLRFRASIGGTSKTINKADMSSTDWFMVGLSWKDSANGNEVKAYLNGSQMGATQTGFSTWSGTPAVHLIGGSLSEPWKGWLAYCAVKFGSVWSATDMANIYAALTGAGPENP